MAYGAENRPDTPPVTDWVNDWDWLDDGWGENAIDIWNDVREVMPSWFHRAVRPRIYARHHGCCSRHR